VLRGPGLRGELRRPGTRVGDLQQRATRLTLEQEVQVLVAAQGASLRLDAEQGAGQVGGLLIGDGRRSRLHEIGHRWILARP
jgi:hypothetical protein